MDTVKSLFLGLLIVALIGFQPTLAAGVPNINLSLSTPAGLGGQALNVPWGGNSISMSQLQSLVASKPGYGQYNIQFPNGLNWGVVPSQLQSLNSSYLQQARMLGYSQSKLPDLSFSSLASMPGANAVMIPLSNMTSSMDQTMQQALRDLRYREMNLSDSLPDWLKSALLWFYTQLVLAFGYVWDNFGAGWDYVRQKLR